MIGGGPAAAELNPEKPGLFNRGDYFDLLAQLRSAAPVCEYAPRSWVLSRYAEVREVSRDPERFCSSKGVLVNDPLRSGGRIVGSVLHTDPPLHGPWRQLVSRSFTPRAMAQLEERVRAITGQVLDRVGGGEVDFVGEVAAPIPVLVIAELLDIADADRHDFRRWSDAAIESTDTDAPDLEALGELHGFLVDHVAHHAAQPGDDLVSALATGEVGGRRVTRAEAATYCMSLLVAGNETTRHLVSGAVDVLAQHPDQRRWLVDNPAGISDAVEECLRWVTPIQAFGRTATRDTVLAGTAISEGDFTVMLYASANRDERAFGATAGAFDVRRPLDSTHVAFGFGEHHCLGAALGRLEGRVFLEELLGRFPAYEVTGEPEWVSSTLVRGMSSLPVRLGR